MVSCNLHHAYNIPPKTYFRWMEYALNNIREQAEHLYRLFFHQITFLEAAITFNAFGIISTLTGAIPNTSPST